MGWIGTAVAGSSKTPPRILFFQLPIIHMRWKNSEIWVPAFFKHNNSFIATVCFFSQLHFQKLLLLHSPEITLTIDQNSLLIDQNNWQSTNDGFVFTF